MIVRVVAYSKCFEEEEFYLFDIVGHVLYIIRNKGIYCNIVLNIVTIMMNILA